MEVNKFLFCLSFLQIPSYKESRKWKWDETMDQMAKLCNVSEKSSYISSNKISHQEVYLGKSVLKTCIKFTGEHSCQSAISIKLLCNFIEIALRHGCSPVNLLHIFRYLLLRTLSEGCFWCKATLLPVRSFVYWKYLLFTYESLIFFLSFIYIWYMFCSCWNMWRRVWNTGIFFIIVLIENQFQEKFSFKCHNNI